jgi:hypothetical protein
MISELVRGQVKIRLIDRGEGTAGAFKPKDPKDVPLLGFEVFTLDLFAEVGDVADHEGDEGGWFLAGKRSTQLPATMTDEEKTTALKVLMDVIHPQITKWGDRSNMLKIDPGRSAVGRYVVRDGHHEVDAEPQARRAGTTHSRREPSESGCHTS